MSIYELKNWVPKERLMLNNPQPEPLTPIRKLARRLNYAQIYGAGDKLLEEILADYKRDYKLDIEVDE